MKGIIFDFNGTLFWDSEIQEKAWRSYAKELSGRDITDEEFNTYFHGRTNKDTLEYILGRELTSEEVYKLSQEKEAIYRKLCKEDLSKFKLAPGVIEFLDFLKEKNIPITIATASEINNVNFFIQEFNLEKWFHREKIVYDDGTFRGKPEPDIYLKAAEKLELEPANCAVFEDAKSGVVSAKRANIGEIVAIVPEGRKNNFLEEDLYAIIKDFYDKAIYELI